MSNKSDSHRMLPIIVCLAMISLPIFSGCTERRRQPRLGVPDATQVENNVEKAMSQIHSDMRFKYSMSNKDVAKNLNAWANKYDQDAQWKKTPLLETLPQRIRESDAVTHLDEMRFTPWDAIYIQESAWAQAVADWATAKRAPGNFRYMIESARQSMNEEELKQFDKSRNLLRDAVAHLHPKLSTEVTNEAAIRAGEISELDQLTRSLQLFDWAVRNVQLTKLPNRPTAAEIEQKSLLRNAGSVASLAGVSGPGYQRMPWNLLTAGEGDAIEKARLFIRLLQQFDVPAVMLAVKDRDDPDSLVPWAVAVVIGGDMYLFDMQLGLPIPGQEMKAVATLAEVVNKPSMLSDLDLKAAESLIDIDYPVVKSQLDHIVALIDAPQQAISKRMKALEPAPAREHRVKLVVDVDELAATVGEFKQIAEVRLWEIPFEAAEFRTALEAARTKSSPQLSHVSHLERDALIDMKVGLVKQGKDEFEVAGLSEARQRFLTGIFSAEKEDKLEGAAQLYNELRLTDEQIREFDTNDNWKAMYGLNEMGDISLVDYKRALESVKIQLRLIRVDATYFLGLTHFENENTMNAINWFEMFQKQLKTGQSEWQQWKHAVAYLNGRSYEALREYDKAFKEYQGDRIDAREAPSAPQHFGNILRIRLLKKWAMPETS